MKRLLIAAVTVLAVGGAAAAALGASSPRARLHHFVCQRALDPAARAVSVTAVMRPLPGTKKLELRFQLRSKSKPSGSYTALSGGDLGTWISPASPSLGSVPGDVWILNKQVVNLAAPASYRFRVFFRWIGTHDHVLGTAVRDSSACTEPELRPDLLVQSIAVSPVTGRPHVNRYVATIRNSGATGAGSFEVLFAPGGASEISTRVVRGLGAHSKVQESFVGPVCTAASPPTITVDPNGQVDEFNQANNSLAAVCPGSSGK
jgi:CARDB